MQRDPVEAAKRRYEEHTQPRIVYPIFEYQMCACCGKEFLLERMWRIDYPYSINTFYNIRHRAKAYGCKHCFPEGKDFRNYLINRNYLDKEGKLW